MGCKSFKSCKRCTTLQPYNIKIKVYKTSKASIILINLFNYKNIVPVEIVPVLH
jgi:hypothetical protein